MGNSASLQQAEYDEFKEKTNREIEQLKSRLLYLERAYNEVNDRIFKLEKTELRSKQPIECDDTIL